MGIEVEVGAYKSTAAAPPAQAGRPAHGTPVLDSHHVESAPSCPPRNPVLRAFVNFQTLLSRTFAPAMPALKRVFTPQGRAAGCVRSHIEQVRQTLTRSTSAPAAIAASLYKLAEAQRQWEGIDPGARSGAGGSDAEPRFDHIVKQLLERWPDETTRSLALALNGERTQQARALVLEKDSTAGWALERLQAIVQPAALERARSDTVRHVEKVLQALASKRTSPAALAADLRGLAAALHRREEISPDAESGFAAAIKSVLARHWPNEKLLALPAAIGSDLARQAQRLVRDADGAAEWGLVQLETLIQNVALERAFDRIDQGLREPLQAIRTRHLSTAIEAQAERAFSQAVDTLHELHDHGLLTPRALGKSLPAHEREPKRLEQTLEIIEHRLGSLAATDEEIGQLIRHLSTEWLQKAWKAPPGSKIGHAVHEEALTRSARCYDEVKQQVQSLGSEGGPLRRDGSLKQVEFAKITALVERSVRHSNAFDGGPSRKLGQALEAMGPLLQQTSKSLSTLKTRAKDRIRDLGDILAAKDTASRISSCVSACKLMTSAVESYLAARQPWGDTPPEDEFKQEFNVLLEEMIADLEAQGLTAGQPQALREALSGGPMHALISVLQQAATQARGAGLPELKRELDQVRYALKQMGKIAGRRSGTANVVSTFLRRSSVSQLDAEAREALEQIYSISITPEDRVRLTAGACPPQFTQLMKSSIEEPFSDTEMKVKTLPGGTRVPAQFLLDGTRAGLILLDPDGEPLIDTTGWNALTDEEKLRRVEEGYNRLLAYYEGNETQTDAILRNANQSLTAAFQVASFQAEDSPIVLEGIGPGLVSGIGLNGTHETVIRFKIGENHRPRVQLHYEARGGCIKPQGFASTSTDTDPSSGTVQLDRRRSKASVTLEAELAPAGDGLKLVGTPTYRANLIRNWAKCPYPRPERRLLLDAGDTQRLYEDLSDYAGEQRPGWLPTLTAMRALRRLDPASGERDLGVRLGNIYESHLRAGAPQLLPQLQPDSPLESRAARRLIELMQKLEHSAVSLFEEVETTARRRLSEEASQHPHEKPSAEAIRLTEFIDAVERWKADPSGRLVQGLSIAESFFVSSPGQAPLFDAQTLGPYVEKSESLSRLIRSSKSLTDGLLLELANQLPEELFTSFADYLPGQIEHRRQLNQQIDSK